MLNAVAGSFHTTGGASIVSVGIDYIQNIGASVRISSGADFDEIVNGKKMIDAHGEIHLRSGKSEIRMQPDGTILLKGTKFIVEEEEKFKVTAGKIELN
jgi:type VI secretion system secreted protein VgrG